MLCCLCNERDAKVHLTYETPEKAKVIERIDLCEECARKHQLNQLTEAGFSMADLLSAVKKARRSP